MITEQELREAIAECQGQRNPNAQTCIKLAAYYTILENTIKQTEEYSFSKPPEIEYTNNTEFAEAIKGKEPAEVWEKIDELLEALEVLNPRLYKSFIRKLQ